VAGHRNQTAAGLLLADVFQFVLWRGLGQEVVHSCLGGNCSGSERVIARDHHGANSHRTKRGKTLLHPTLNDVFQVNETENLRTIGYGKRSTAISRDSFGSFRQGWRR